MKSIAIRLLLACALALAAVTRRAAPAAAGGTIYAEIWLTNNTAQCIPIPFSGASTGQVWGTPGNTLKDFSSYEVMPDGSPPRMLGAHQTMMWGSKSNGGFGSTTGTGGALTFPLPGDQTASLSWSVPWSYFNGFGGGAGSSANVSSGPFGAPTNPYELSGGALSCGPDGANTCLFAFTLTGGDPGESYGPGTMPEGQCISMPTSCPAGNCASGLHSLTSADGSTTLSFVDNSSFGAPTAWAGNLELFDSKTYALWQAGNYVVAAQVVAGNFVAYAANGDVVWQSSSSGGAASYLSVGTSEVSVLDPDAPCRVIDKRLVCPRLEVPRILWGGKGHKPGGPIAGARMRGARAATAGSVPAHAATDLRPAAPQPAHTCSQLSSCSHSLVIAFPG